MSDPTQHTGSNYEVMREAYADLHRRVTAALADVDWLIDLHVDHCTTTAPCNTRATLAIIRATLTGGDDHG